MTVAELIEKLKTFDPNAKVVIRAEEIYDIEAVKLYKQPKIPDWVAPSYKNHYLDGSVVIE